MEKEKERKEPRDRIARGGLLRNGASREGRREGGQKETIINILVKLSLKFLYIYAIKMNILYVNSRIKLLEQYLFLKLIFHFVLYYWKVQREGLTKINGYHLLNTIF